MADMFGNIPILSRLYELDNIRSVDENGSWPKNIWVTCEEIIGKSHCIVIVNDHLYTTKAPDQPTLCKLEIFMRDRDLATALVTRGIAQWQ